MRLVSSAAWFSGCGTMVVPRASHLDINRSETPRCFEKPRSVIRNASLSARVSRPVQVVTVKGSFVLDSMARAYTHDHCSNEIQIFQSRITSATRSELNGPTWGAWEMLHDCGQTHSREEFRSKSWMFPGKPCGGGSAEDTLSFAHSDANARCSETQIRSCSARPTSRWICAPRFTGFHGGRHSWTCRML